MPGTISTSTSVALQCTEGHGHFRTYLCLESEDAWPDLLALRIVHSLRGSTFWISKLQPCTWLSDLSPFALDHVSGGQQASHLHDWVRLQVPDDVLHVLCVHGTACSNNKCVRAMWTW